MRPTVRRAATAALSVVLLSGLAACGEGDSATSGEALTKVELVYSGALTVCTDMPYEPFEYMKDGQPAGFDMDLARAIAEDLDVQLDVLTTPFDDIVSGQALNDDVCDVAASAISITGERARVIDFSSPYFDATQALVAPKARPELTDLSSLASGVRVGVQAGTTGETYLRDNAKGAKIVTFADAKQLTDAIIAGEVGAAVYDSPAAAQVVANNDVLHVTSEFPGEQYGMAVKKDGNMPLLRRINSILSDVRESGAYDEIYNSYF